MTTDEKYIKSMNILKEIYSELYYIVETKPDAHYYRVLDKKIYNIIGGGYYSLSGIDFTYCSDETFKYLINKLIELNVGVFDIGKDGLRLYFYNKLKNIKI